MSDNIHSCSPFCMLPACVKQRQRRDFEAFMHVAGKGRANAEMFDVDANSDYVSPTIYATFYGWQAATERATAIERERCAKVCDGRVYALDHAGKQYRREWAASQCAAAIRQGGAA